MQLARVAFELLRPGGRFVLLREPTLSLLRRTRDHGVEDEHGRSSASTPHAATCARCAPPGSRLSPSIRAAGGFTTPRQRAILRPPLSWLNGIAFAEWTYVGVRPAAS